MEYKLFWSEEALKNLEEILDYLKNNWTPKETEHFKLKLTKLLDLIISYPLMFPHSDYNPRLRKAVLSRQTTIFYEVKDNIIHIAYLFVSWQNIERLK
jgi:plasmid stabilization system protein ParE